MKFLFKKTNKFFILSFFGFFFLTFELIFLRDGLRKLKRRKISCQKKKRRKLKGGGGGGGGCLKKHTLFYFFCITYLRILKNFSE